MSSVDELLLRDAQAPLPDDGFTTRVMAALPVPAVAPRPWLRPLLVLGSAALGSVLALLLAPGDSNLLQGFADLVQLRGLTPAALVGLGMSGALLVSALVLAADD